MGKNARFMTEQSELLHASLFRELFGHVGTQPTSIAALQDKLTEEVATNSALRD